MHFLKIKTFNSYEKYYNLILYDALHPIDGTNDGGRHRSQ